MSKKNLQFLQVSLVCGGDVLCCVCAVVLLKIRMVLHVVRWVFAPSSFPTE